MSEVSDMIRKVFKEGDDKRDAGLTTPEGIRRFDDIVYGNDDACQVLDVYRPKEAEGDLPVIVSVHGGGWVYGDKERYQYYCMDLAMRGFAVVNFTYRLAPEHKYPASIEDTNLVFSWVLEHGKEYGFDTEHVYGVGDSAGAHNLSLYPEYAAEYPFQPPVGFVPTAIALNCGVYKLTPPKDETDQTGILMSDYLPGKGTEEELHRVSVVNHITPDYPPVFLMTCTDDFAASQAPGMVEMLMKCKVPFVFRYYGDKEHPLGHVFHCNIRLKESDLCSGEECEFFRKYQ